MKVEVGDIFGNFIEQNPMELKINGLRFSAEVLASLAPESGTWQGPFWVRRNVSRQVVDITRKDPSSYDVVESPTELPPPTATPTP